MLHPHSREYCARDVTAVINLISNLSPQPILRTLPPKAPFGPCLIVSAVLLSHCCGALISTSCSSQLRWRQISGDRVRPYPRRRISSRCRRWSRPSTGAAGSRSHSRSRPSRFSSSGSSFSCRTSRRARPTANATLKLRRFGRRRSASRASSTGCPSCAWARSRFGASSTRLSNTLATWESSQLSPSSRSSARAF